jgi:FkbM family methyltransferase
MNFIKNNTPITICDIGASPCDPTEHIEELFNKTNSFLYGFEPNKDEYEKLKILEIGGNKKFYNTALGDGHEKTLNICAYPGWTSFLEPDTDYIKKFHNFEENSKIISRDNLKTEKLDNIDFDYEIDFFKIDVQGYESIIIANGINKISNSLVVQLELSPTPIYKEEKRFSHVAKQMEELKFNLNMFSNINTRTFKPMIVGNQPGVGLNTIFQLDCIFVKDFDEINSFNDEKLKKLILIMFHCYKSYDFVDYLICKLDKISNTTYIKEYRKLIPSLKISKKY